MHPGFMNHGKLHAPRLPIRLGPGRVSHGWVVVSGLLLLGSTGFSGGPSPGAEIPASDVLGTLPEARSLGIYRDPAPKMLAPVLEARSRREPESVVAAWVFFTDKGIGTRQDLDRALDRFRDGLGAKARSRRASLGADLGADFRDLPVHAGYVDALRRNGFRVRRASRWMNAASIEVPAGRLPELASLPFVHSVRPMLTKRALRSPLAPPRLPGVEPGGADPARGAETPLGTTACVIPVIDPVEAAFYGPSYNQLGEIQALDLHRLGYSGAGVRVMVLDTGFQKSHPAFRHTRWIAEWDFVNEDGETGPQAGDHSQQHYHGTGVWGTAGGFAPGALIGPAFAAEYVLAKTEDIVNEVRAEEDNYVAALEWADTLGVDVATASLAYFVFDDSTGYTTAQLDGDTAVITRAVDIAVAKGMVCVNSAGNEGPADTTIWTPADADSVIAVGAIDSCGVVQTFSSRGPTADGRVKPDVSARGRNTYWARAWTNGYGPASGTSLSAPLVGGLAALLKEAHPDWSGATIREAILAGAIRTGPPDNALGYGIAQGMAAFAYGGASPEPPRMTMPFRLVSPVAGTVVPDARPTLVWNASAPTHPGEIPVYRVLVDDAAGFPSPDTVYVGPDTTFTFVLAPPAGAETRWRVEATGDLGFTRVALGDGRFTVSSALALGPGEPSSARFALGSASPNPMRARTAFRIEAPAGERVALEIVDVAGRRVSRMEFTGVGRSVDVTWDGTDDAGRRVPAGMYFYRLAGRPGIAAQKLLVIP